MFFFLASEKTLSVWGRNKGLWAAQSISRNFPSGIQKGRGVIPWEEQIRGGSKENYLSVFPQRNSKGEQGAIPWEEQIRGEGKAIYLYASSGEPSRRPCFLLCLCVHFCSPWIASQHYIFERVSQKNSYRQRTKQLHQPSIKLELSNMIGKIETNLVIKLVF